MSVTLTVRQGSIEEELVVPEPTLIGGFRDLWRLWEHASKFKLTNDSGRCGCSSAQRAALLGSCLVICLAFLTVICKAGPAPVPSREHLLHGLAWRPIPTSGGQRQAPLRDKPCNGFL